MEILIKVLSAVSQFLHTDNKTIVYILGAALAIVIIIALAKKAFKLVISVGLVAIILVGINIAIGLLDKNAGVSFESETQSIIIDTNNIRDDGSLSIKLSKADKMVMIVNDVEALYKLGLESLDHISITTSEQGETTLNIHEKNGNIGQVIIEQDRAKVIDQVLSVYNLVTDQAKD